MCLEILRPIGEKLILRPSVTVSWKQALSTISDADLLSIHMSRTDLTSKLKEVCISRKQAKGKIDHGGCAGKGSRVVRGLGSDLTVLPHLVSGKGVC